MGWIFESFGVEFFEESDLNGVEFWVIWCRIWLCDGWILTLFRWKF